MRGFNTLDRRFDGLNSRFDSFLKMDYWSDTRDVDFDYDYSYTDTFEDSRGYLVSKFVLK